MRYYLQCLAQEKVGRRKRKITKIVKNKKRTFLIKIRSKKEKKKKKKKNRRPTQETSRLLL